MLVKFCTDLSKTVWGTFGNRLGLVTALMLVVLGLDIFNIGSKGIRNAPQFISCSPTYLGNALLVQYLLPSLLYQMDELILVWGSFQQMWATHLGQMLKFKGHM